MACVESGCRVTNEHVLTRRLVPEGYQLIYRYRR
jgi:hypothetical protein